jgi:hypothetical protein
MTKKLIPIVIAFLLGAAVASFGKVSAEPQPPWDRDLVRQLVNTLEAQQRILEGTLRQEEQQARALHELVRAAGRCAR